MKRDLDYIMEVARAFVRGKTPPAPPGTVRWDRMKRHLERHRVMATFAPYIGASNISPSERKELEQMARAIERRNAFLLLELGRFLPALEEAGCSPVVLKGPALAETVYRSRGQRFFADLDILVRKDRLDTACAVLQQLGVGPAVTTFPPAFYDQYHFHRILSTRSGVLVELHWDLVGPESFYHFDLERLLRRTQNVAFGDGSMRILSPRDQLLHITIQCLNEGFSNFRHLLDARLLFPRIDDLSALADQARVQGLATGLWLLLSLCQELFGLEGSAETLHVLAPRPAVRRCLESLELLQKCLACYAASHPDFIHLVDWLCSPRLAIAARLVRRFILPRGGDLWQAGHHPSESRGLIQRGRLTLLRMRSTVQLIAHQLRCLADC